MVGFRRSHSIYLPTRQDREEEKKAETAEYADLVVPEALPRAKPEEEPEYASIEDFVEFCMDDDRDAFKLPDVQKLRKSTGEMPRTIIKALESYGLTYEAPEHVREVRGINANPHNRFAGNPMCGGSGFDPNAIVRR